MVTSTAKHATKALEAVSDWNKQKRVYESLKDQGYAASKKLEKSQSAITRTSQIIAPSEKRSNTKGIAKEGATHAARKSRRGITLPKKTVYARAKLGMTKEVQNFGRVLDVLHENKKMVEKAEKTLEKHAQSVSAHYRKYKQSLKADKPYDIEEIELGNELRNNKATIEAYAEQNYK
jgi:hypothetical protein